MASRLSFPASARLALAVVGALALGVPAGAAWAAPGALCPVPLDQLHNRPGVVNPSVAVCVDRGAGAVYAESEPITVCVSVSVPMIMIYPPPPDPLVRVTNSTNGGPEHELFAEQFNGGQRCFTSTIQPPLGDDLFRARVISQSGSTIAQDEVRIVSVPR